jgi:hypothetical protein
MTDLVQNLILTTEGCITECTLIAFHATNLSIKEVAAEFLGVLCWQ